MASSKNNNMETKEVRRLQVINRAGIETMLNYYYQIQKNLQIFLST